MDRFWNKVDVGDEDECWPWLAHRDRAGYGRFNADGSPEAAHRVAYRLATGDIPADRVVMHSCDNRACCNPEHLSLGTQQDNILDMYAKGRQAVRVAGTKLTREHASAIRALRASGGYLQRELAGLFGITQVHVSQILRGVSWSR